MYINSLTFEQKIKKALGYRAPQLVFDIKASEYAAYFRPKYPEQSAADLIIVYDFEISRLKIIGNFEALLPTTKYYESFEKLLADLCAMDEAHPIATRYIVVDFFATEQEIGNDGVYDTFTEAQKAMLNDFADYVDCYIESGEELRKAIQGRATIDKINEACEDSRCYITEATARYSDDYDHESDCFWRILEI